MSNEGRPKRQPTRRAPTVKHTPGMADELMRELAPLLAEDGIDLEHPAADIETLQAALDRAVERRNMQLFTPVGPARDDAVAILGLVVTYIDKDQPERAAEVLDRVPSEATEVKPASVAHCIGLALGLLDTWLGSRDTTAPGGLAYDLVVPDSELYGGEAASKVLRLACQGNAFGSVGRLITDYGGHTVLFASALALAFAIDAWAEIEGKTMRDIAEAFIR